MYGLVVEETHRGMQFHGGGAHRREPSGKRVLQGVHDRERTPVLEQDVVEAAQRMAGQGRQHAEHEVIQQQVEEVPRERGERRASRVGCERACSAPIGP